MTRRPVLPAAFAAVLLVVGQLVALAHEAGARHVTCARHGEVLDGAVLAGTHHSETQQWVAVEGDGGGHTDCAIARALHQTTTRSSSLVATTVVAQTRIDVAPVATAHSYSSLYRIAPKTSPPSELTSS